MTSSRAFALFGPCILLLALSVASAQEAGEAPAAAPPAEKPATEEPAPAGVDDRAKALYQEGREAFNVGEFEAAVKKFREAFELSKKPALLYNIAFAHDKAGQNEKAVFFYERYLAEDPEAPEARTSAVASRVEALKAKIEQRRTTERREAALRDEERKAALLAEEQRRQEEKDKSIIHKWWLWTIVGVVVAGGVTTGLVLGLRKKDDGIPSTELGNIPGGLTWQWR